jgi:hypothetical protein
VVADGRADLLDHFLGQGFAVLAPSRTELLRTRDLDPDLWERLGTRFALIASTADQAQTLDPRDFYTVLVDEEGALQAWFVNHRARSVVLRPDRHIFGINPTQKRITKVRRYLYPEEGI